MVYFSARVFFVLLDLKIHGTPKVIFSLSFPSVETKRGFSNSTFILSLKLVNCVTFQLLTLGQTTVSALLLLMYLTLKNKDLLMDFTVRGLNRSSGSSLSENDNSISPFWRILSNLMSIAYNSYSSSFRIDMREFSLVFSSFDI